jgi:hypothetical protein
MEPAEENQSWWFAATDGLHGPFSQGEIFEAIRMGRVQQGTLIRQGEQGDWAAAISVFRVAFPSSGSEWAPNPAQQVTNSGSSGSINDLNGKVDVGITVLLSVITLGIYWDIWIYKRLGWYSEMSGRPMGNRVNYFWLFIGLIAGATALSLLTGGVFLILAVPLAIASVVFASLLISDLGKDQEVIALRTPTSKLPASMATLVILWAVGNGIGFTIILFPVGVVMIIFFFIYFFRNHNTIIDSLTQ